MQTRGTARKGLIARLRDRRRERASRTADSPERASERARAGQYAQSPVEGQGSGAVVESALGLGSGRERKQHSSA
jgi:hypothetical protein